jgi:hypothetical protein
MVEPINLFRLRQSIAARAAKTDSVSRDILQKRRLADADASAGVQDDTDPNPDHGGTPRHTRRSAVQIGRLRRDSAEKVHACCIRTSEA